MTTLPDLDPDSDSYYRPLGDGRYLPTLHAQGAWQAHEQHMAPVSGLLMHCLEEFNPRPDLQVGRVTYDILGLIPAAESVVECRTVRRGRTIELDEATMSVGGRPVVRATAWRLATGDSTAVAGNEPPTMPGPDDITTWDGRTRWGGGFIASLEFRAGEVRAPGVGQVWVRTTKSLVEGVDSTPLASLLTLVDTANGVSTLVEPVDWMFPNTDLTVHLHRAPEAGDGWVGLQTHVTFGPTGLGITSTVLHDERGPIGRAQQILTVRPMPTT